MSVQIIVLLALSTFFRVSGSSNSSGGIFFRWYNAEEGDENLHYSAWKEGHIPRKDIFQEWRERCTTKLSREHSMHKLRSFHPSKVRSLCYSPLSYRERSSKCREVVGLMSEEGHGNHAVRWILEQATGVVSASIYGDFAHLEALGVGWKQSNVLEVGSIGAAIVVKSHKGKISGRLAQFHKANSHKRTVIIVREPLGAILANYNRIGHLYKIPCSRAVLIKHKNSFKLHTSQLEDWSSPRRQQHFTEYARCEARKWVRRMMSKSHLPREWKNPILVIRFEDLLSKTSQVLKLLLAFLRVPSLSKMQYECALSVSQSTRRPKQANAVDPWDHQFAARNATLSTEGMCNALRHFHYHNLAGEACP